VLAQPEGEAHVPSSAAAPGPAVGDHLAVLGASVRVVDLSLLVAEAYPGHWPTHLPFQHKTWSWFTEIDTPVGSAYGHLGPYTTRWLLMDEHTATHVDAPRHFLPPPGFGLPDEHPLGAITVEQVPLPQLMGPARVMDVRDLVGTTPPGVSPAVTLERLEAWEAEQGVLAAGDVLLLRSDWDLRYRPGAEGAAYCHEVIVTKQASGWPAPSPQLVLAVAERGVRCLGTDAPSVGAAQDGQPVHVAGLGAGLVFLECLARLGTIPAKGAFFVFAPLKLEGGSGAPGRAFALVPDEGGILPPALPPRS
jgi:isatin hydrolase